MADACLYYDLERYLLEIVRPRFRNNGWIGAFDFFSIVIWKANRAKSKVANKMQRISGEKDLEKICHKITKSLGRAKDDKERMYILISKWEFRLPMASAILTILYPDKFTVYDYRAAEQVGDDSKLNTKSNFEAIWTGYLKFKNLVVKTGEGKLLRDKDRFLFGKSRMEDLERDIKSGFKK
ncbi:MAG: hypothetical protein ABR955_04850 [Verrucomicrobiota bacterium]|jgi:hypothetical protein